ncbi:MAG: hypothetical protein Q9174_003330 [Haloplaca sp. 1 TL-2023]
MAQARAQAQAPASAPTMVTSVTNIDFPTSAEDLAVDLASVPALPPNKDQRHMLSFAEQAEMKARYANLLTLRTERKRMIPAGAVKKGGIHYENVPLIECGDIMDDMVDRAMSEPSLIRDLQRNLAQAPLRVATMCSGTESPLLALNEVKACEFTTSAVVHVYIRYAMADQRTALAARGIILQYEHCFSAEIEPVKQAYIQANFNPKIIFNDVNELCNSTATTAFGSLVPVPGGIDLVMAGFSCVDASKLNKNRRDVTDSGETGDTLRAIIRYARKYRPKILLLENIEQNQWSKIQAMIENDRSCKGVTRKMLEELWGEDVHPNTGYSCHVSQADTREYNTPQTRNRRYLIAIDRSQIGKAAADMLACKWAELFEGTMPQHASVPAEALLLPPGDPRLNAVYARAHYNDNGEKRGRKTATWDACKIRYSDFRDKEGLGNARPYTKYTESGACYPPEYWLRPWVRIQTDRVMEHFEQSLLRKVRVGYDPLHKTRIIDLSQNIDRALDNAQEGVTTCLTPSMVSLVTTRGGPVTGWEAMRIQGLPADKLLLGRMTEGQIKDMAGNAMSTPVVGAAILALLTACSSILIPTGPPRGHEKVAEDRSGRNQAMGIKSLGTDAILDVTSYERTSIQSLLELANRTRTQCYCETQVTNSDSAIFRCKNCEHTACADCKSIHNHDYAKVGGRPRERPLDVAATLHKALPMRLCLDGQRISDLAKFDYAKRWGNPVDLTIVSKPLRSALLEEFRFLRIRRTRWGWVAVFQGQSLDLQLRLKATEAEWHMYARPHKLLAGISRERQLVRQPIARMVVNAQGSDLLDGQWEVCIPVDRNLELKIDGTKYGKVASWQNELGIMKWAKTKVAKAVDIEARLPQDRSEVNHEPWKKPVLDADSQMAADLAERLSGHYKLLPKCETACRSLFKKTTPDHDGSHLYFFLDPHRATTPTVDRYNFAKSHDRLEFKEIREILAHLAQEWEPLKPAKRAECVVLNHKQRVDWTLKPFKGGMPVSFRLAQDLGSQVLRQDERSNTTTCSPKHVALASIRVPTSVRPNTNVESELVQSANQQMLFQTNDWVLSRMPWESLHSTQWHSIHLSEEVCMCHICNPRLPTLRFKHKLRLTRDGQKTVDPRLTVYEDEKQAADFERGLKSRLPLLMAKWSLKEGRIKTGIDMKSLAHRTLVKTSIKTGDKVSLRYRIQALPKPGVVTILPPYALSSTAKVQDPDLQEQFFDAGYPQLRPEQRNTVRRMLLQEDPQLFDPFRQQALEEAYVEGHNVHVMMSSFKDRTCLGGVAAHEVGYGKTALILALFHKTQQVPAFFPPAPRGKISSKATLILVPGTIVRQWNQQVEKFLGTQYKVVVIPNMGAYRKITVQEIQNADIIIIDSNLMQSGAYKDALSGLSALPPQSRTNPWAAATWFDHATRRIDELIGRMGESHLPSIRDELINSFVDTCLDPKLFREVAASRKVGKNYIGYRSKTKREKTPDEKATDGTEQPIDDKEKLRELGSERLKRFKFDQKEAGLQQMTSPPLHMFMFNRLVVDEVTYIEGSARTYVAGIPALKRWVLSGTPRIGDFTEVNSLASFLDLNLGDSIDDPAVTKEYNVERMRKAFTETQKFLSAYRHYTMHFHAEQQRSGQEFLDHLARQDEPEIEEILVNYHIFGVYCRSGQLIGAMQIEELSRGDEMPRGAPTKLPDVGRNLQRDLLKDHTNNIQSRLEFHCHSKPEAIGNAFWSIVAELTYRAGQYDFFIDHLVYVLRGIATLHRMFRRSSARAFGRAYSPVDEWLKRIMNNKTTHKELNPLILEIFARLQDERSPLLDDIKALFDQGPGAAITRRDAKWIIAHKLERDEEIALWDYLYLDEYAKKRIFNTSHIFREWVERRREIRLYSQALELQKWVADQKNVAAPTCSACGIVIRNPDDAMLLVACGHVACPRCIERAIESSQYCLAEHCAGRGTHGRDNSARRVGRPVDETSYAAHYGAKIGRVIELIKNEIPAKEQVLLFVQFDSVMQGISKALTEVGISNYAINHKATARNRQKWMAAFQEDTGAAARKVLILDSTKDTAAGANLTNANHVIFLSTFWTDNTHAYHQSITQCVGRSKRFGQKKIVQVYRIIAMESIEVDLLQWRENKKLVHTSDDKYELVPWDRVSELSEAQKAQDFTTGELKESGYLDREE